MPPLDSMAKTNIEVKTKKFACTQFLNLFCF